MPATNIVVCERRGIIAARISHAIHALPVWLHQARTVDDHRRYLRQGPFPITVFDVDLGMEIAAQLLVDTIHHRGRSVAVGSVSSWSDMIELRELGVIGVVPASHPAVKWRPLLERLVHQSQQRIEYSGGAAKSPGTKVADEAGHVRKAAQSR